jgi:hypothetical protein
MQIHEAELKTRKASPMRPRPGVAVPALKGGDVDRTSPVRPLSAFAVPALTGSDIDRAAEIQLEWAHQRIHELEQEVRMLYTPASTT